MNPLRGARVLITAGPTREHLDPVRFLTNPSSGKMGFALARAARDMGARVTVVSGPVDPPAGLKGVRVLPVTTALQMRRRTVAEAKRADMVIAAAAVGDWRFARASARKIKKSDKPLRLTLLPNPDIVAELARKRSGSRPVLVGFALETHRRLANAREKMRRKGLDLIVANGTDALGGRSTSAAILRREARTRVLPRMGKDRAAREIRKAAAPLLAR